MHAACNKKGAIQDRAVYLYAIVVQLKVIHGEIECHRFGSAPYLVLHVCFLVSLSPSGQGALPPQHTFQLFTLAKNCLERAESIYTTVQREGRDFTTASGSPQLQKCVCVCVCVLGGEGRGGEGRVMFDMKGVQYICCTVVAAVQ